MERERERKTHIRVRAKHQLVASCTPPTWDRACNLTRNRNRDLSVCGMKPNQSGHTGQAHGSINRGISA